MPASGQAHWRLGRLYQVRQRDIDARREFERALASDPVSGADRLLAAIARWHARELNGAMEHLAARWTAKHPDGPLSIARTVRLATGGRTSRVRIHVTG